MKKKIKRDYEMAARTTISMPQLMLDQANSRARAMNIYNFSQYIQNLVRADLEKRAA